MRDLKHLHCKCEKYNQMKERMNEWMCACGWSKGVGVRKTGKEKLLGLNE